MKAISKKSTILKELEELGVEWMRSKLQDVYASTIIDGDMDFKVEVFVIKDEEYVETTGFKPINIHEYQSCRCGCEHDCCGHVSSRLVDVINNRNGYISVFFTTHFNY